MRRVVITGMGLVTPLGCGVEASWGRLVDGVSGAGPIKGFDVSDLSARIACQVPLGEEEHAFEPVSWVPAKDLKKLDTFIAFGLAAAQQAVDDAGWTPEDERSRSRTGVMIGSGIGGLPAMEAGSIQLHEQGPRRISPFLIPSTLINLLSGHVSIRFGYTGPNHSAVTACSTGAHAIGDASRLIQRDDVDVMLAGRRRGRDLPNRRRRFRRGARSLDPIQRSTEPRLAAVGPRP